MKTLRVPVCDGILDKLSVQLFSPFFPQPSLWEGMFFITELGLCMSGDGAWERAGKVASTVGIVCLFILDSFFVFHM